MNYYTMNFTMTFDYNKDLNFFDEIPPFERDIYIDMLIMKMKNKTKEKSNQLASEPRREEFE
jgi:hypothetical protein